MKNRAPRLSKRLPHSALLILSAVLAGVVVYLTWPTRGAVFCEQLPQLTAFAVCAASLLVFSFRALALAYAARQKGLSEDARIAGGAAILAGLAFFLAAHFIAQYRKPCAAVQQQFRQGGQHPPAKSP